MCQIKVIFPNPEKFEKKKREFIEAGSNSFHVVSDFDRCLTKAFIDGKKASTSYSLIREGGYLGTDYVKQAYSLFNHYHPIEISNNISQEKRNIKMVEWWHKHNKLIVDCGMNMDVIMDIVQKNSIHAREGAFEFLDILMGDNVPILIFSAGLGNIIKEYLEHEGKLNKNMHIIANFFEFNNSGDVIGYKSKIVHTYNKNEILIKDTAYYNEIKKRKNVLLLGDSIGDIGMSEGIEHKTIIKIGFLNENIENLLDEYKRAFDLLILNDGHMHYVNEFVNEIVK